MPADQPSASISAIERLTEKERECLRLWLEHKTAKEIALRLDVSHHAVEKRLKMARTKLGVATSLEAARVLAQAEGYDWSVTGPLDLPDDAIDDKGWRRRTIILGGIAMFIVTVFALATALQPVEPDKIAVDGNLERVFELLDHDRSGYLENPEAPFVTVEFFDRSDPVESDGVAFLGENSDPTQVDDFYATADADADGRVSFDEYEAWSVERWSEIDIDVSDITTVVRSPES